jgi:hypothetical protein
MCADLTVIGIDRFEPMTRHIRCEIYIGQDRDCSYQRHISCQNRTRVNQRDRFSSRSRLLFSTASIRSISMNKRSF